MEKYKQFNIGNVELPILNAFRLTVMWNVGFKL